jgi:hypothetical protein
VDRRHLGVCTLAAVGASLACVRPPGGSSATAVAASPLPARCTWSPPAAPSPNSWRKAKRALAPSGPNQIRLCRYAFRATPRGADRDQLVGRRLVTRANAAKLVHAFDALRAAKHGRSFTSCFFNTAPVVAYLEYPDGHSVTIFVVTSNCWSAANGDLTRSAGRAAWHRLRKALLRLTAS